MAVEICNDSHPFAACLPFGISVNLIHGNFKEIAMVSEADYFACLESIEGKAEYQNGVIYDMAGGSPRHGLITMNCGTAIGSQLKDKNCGVYSPDVLLGVELAHSYFFPDLFVACGKLELDKVNRNAVKNPQVIVEVLSPSTMDRDRTSKLLRYIQIPSLQEYILVEQHKALVDVCFINDRGVWDSETVRGLDAMVKIRSLGIEVAMADIYRLVDFEVPTEPS
jgi:Uma2 family endonuclease